MYLRSTAKAEQNKPVYISSNDKKRTEKLIGLEHMTLFNQVWWYFYR